MNSTLFLLKSVPYGNSYQIKRTFLNVTEYYLQFTCSASNFKPHTSINSRNYESDKKVKKSTIYVEESDNFKTINKPPHKGFKTKHFSSDEFGTLDKSLEKDFKIKHASPVYNNNKLIKIRKPLNDESDIFGNLSESKPFWCSDFNEEPKVDNDLSDDSVILKTFDKRLRDPRQYLSEMKRLVKDKKVKDALNLFVTMRREFVAPIKPHYTYMIGACGRVGYTEMAFKLFRQMTDRAFTPSPACLTGLFNACAESPFPEYGLKKAHSLREKIKAKNWPLTQINYHAMIKAFGKCGDLVTAFSIVDEMAEADIKINAETYNFLLTSCITNREAGFTYAVEVWRKMKAKRCVPDIFTFNLLLRTARDCGIGPEEISCLLLQHWSSYSKRPYGFITKEELLKEPVLELKSGTSNVISEPPKSVPKKSHDLENKDKNLNESLENKEASSELQNIANKSIEIQNSDSSPTSLLSARPLYGPEILEIASIKTASDRLNLIGGVEGFLKSMQETNVKPDIKTFALLLECLPDNIKDEDDLLSIIDIYKIKPTIEFFNILIKRRNLRKETEAAHKCLLLMNKYELSPDIMTFGALALGCRTLRRAIIFIEEMKKFGTSPNIQIAGSLVRAACCALDFSYMKYALQVMEEEDVKPDAKLLSTVEKTLSDVRKNIILMEQGKKCDDFYQQRSNLADDFKEFCNFYEDWLKRMKFECEEHPWSQYKTEIIDKAKEENFAY